MNKNSKILIIDDNEEVLIALKLFLAEHYKSITTEKNPNRIPELFHNNSFDVVILDMNFTAGINTGNEGLFWMKKILEIDNQAIIVLITAYGDIDLAVKAIKEGASDFIQKPWDDDKLLGTILKACKLRLSKLEIKKLKNQQQHLHENIDKQYEMCIGKSEAMKNVMTTVKKVAGTDANVLILGENGTGKELIAREIHKQSARSGEMFVSVDMASLTESLFESELFGHKKGSFTDAREDRAGRFEIACGGSLFLDEIGNLPTALQSKLLTVLQNREIVRIGSNRTIPIDIRLITATNMSLYEMVESGTFREDLLYRINTIQIELPPLRERKDDIPEMLGYFLKKYTKKYHKPFFRISSSAVDKLKKHHWPGNVRELQHTVEKAVILCESDIMRPEDFIFNSAGKSKAKEIFSLNLKDQESQLIRLAIEKNDGNLSKSAEDLGITRKTIYNKIKKYNI